MIDDDDDDDDDEDDDDDDNDDDNDAGNDDDGACDGSSFSFCRGNCLQSQPPHCLRVSSSGSAKVISAASVGEGARTEAR